MIKMVIIVLILIGTSSLISFYFMNNTFSGDVDFTKMEKNRIIFFDFENNLKNDPTTICKSKCDGIINGKIKYVNSNDQNSITFNDEHEGWVEIPLDEIKIQNKNGVSISFWINVHTHEMRHNMIYNKGPVGWGSSYLKSINGLYEGDLKKFQALWTGNNVKQYLNIICDDGQEIKLDKWYYVVHVLENDQSTLRQFINGKEYCNTKSKIPINFEIENNLILGKVVGTYNDKSNLTIDDFAIHNYALNKNEIQRNFMIGYNIFK